MLLSIEDFCSPSRWGPFEYPKLTPIGGTPDIGDFTRCFEDIIICSVVPFSALLLGCLFSARRFRSSVAVVSEYTPLLLNEGSSDMVDPDAEETSSCSVAMARPLKYFFIVVALCIALAQVIFALVTSHPIYATVSSTASFVIWALVLILAIQEELKKLKTTAALLFFNVVIISTACVKVRTVSRKGELDLVWDILFFVSFANNFLVLLALLLCPGVNQTFEDERNGARGESKANFIFRLTYWWITPLFRLARRKNLAIKELAPLPSKEAASQISANFEEIQDDLYAANKYSLARSLFHLIGRSFWKQAVCLLLSTLFSFIGPICLFAVVGYIEGEQAPPELVAAYIIGLLFGPVLVSFLEQLFMHMGVRVGMQVRASIIGAIYRKSLKLSVSSRQAMGIPNISALISIDAEKMRDLPLYFHRIWASMLQVVIAVLFLVKLIGPSAFAGLGVMLLVLPVNWWISKISSDMQNRLMNNYDERLSLISEIFSSIRSIKLFAWESFFETKLKEKRAKEMSSLKWHIYFQAVSFLVWQGAPVGVSIVTFGVYGVVLEKPLDPKVIFTALALFNLLKMPLYLLPIVISKCIDGANSYGHIDRYLNHFEIPTVSRPAEKKPSIRIREGGFKWDDRDPDLTLRSISVDIRAGKMVSITGPPGCGKTSLAKAFLGELVTIYGSVYVKGRIAYLPEKPWLRAGKIRDNILFGLPFDPEKYEKAVLSCCLIKDFMLLDRGDEEEIGEKGPELSPSLSQRICLARAVYRVLCGKADILLLDDPLALVEPSLRHKLFRDCLCDLLRGFTRVVMTKNLGLCLPNSDHVIVMNEGEIIEQGPYHELIKKNGPLCELISSCRVLGLEDDKVDEEGERYRQSIQEKSDSIEDDADQDDGEIADVIFKRALGEAKSPRRTETKRSGGTSRSNKTFKKHQTSFRTYVTYFVACGGLFYFLSLLFIFTISQIGQIIMDFWLSWWIGDRFQRATSGTTYYDIYVYIGVAVILLILIRSLFVAYGSIRAANKFHNLLIGSIFHSQLVFFEKIPFGLIMARVGRDLQGIEQILSSEISDLFTFAFTTVGTMAIISIITPFFIMAMLPVSVAFAFIAIYYIQAARQLKKLDQQSRVRLYQHFTETLQGLTTVRSFDVARDFVLENEANVDDNHRSYWSLMVSNRWLGLHLEFVGSMVVFFAGLFVILYRYQLTGAAAGLSLTYALSVTNTLNWLVRTIAEVDMGLSSVDRVLDLQASAQEHSPPTEDFCSPPPNWPSKGKVVFSNVVAKTNPSAAPVLNRISLETKAMEKIGILGEKNSGKRALLDILFRFSTVEAGSVKIDNVEIHLLDPSYVRSVIGVVPFQHLVFSGTLRENLDPFRKFQDYDIWAALRKVSLDEWVSDLPLKLDTFISQTESLTNGQMILLSLARILLKGSKIVVFDEFPTGDVTTEALVQRTIRMHFTDCTVFCVSKVLKNIIDYDRVMVMEKGKLVEFDSPSNLLADSSSRFHNICRMSGEFELLNQLAGQKEYVLEELSASVQTVGSAELGSSFLRAHLFSSKHAGSGAGSSSLGSSGVGSSGQGSGHHGLHLHHSHHSHGHLPPHSILHQSPHHVNTTSSSSFTSTSPANTSGSRYHTHYYIRSRSFVGSMVN